MRAGDEPTEFLDFASLLSAPIKGELPLLVGGHAVNVWAWFYRKRIGKVLNDWLPLTSKDLDLVGTVAMLEELKQMFGGQYRLSGPRSPVVGQLTFEIGGKNLKVDVLKDVFGLDPKDLKLEAPVIHLSSEGGGQKVRVIAPIILLQAKAANLAKLDQKDRNDHKHVCLMLLVVRAYLTELLETVEAGAIDSRRAIIQLELARKVASSSEAIRCERDHGVDFGSMWPRELLEAAKDPRIMNFVKHRLPG